MRTEQKAQLRREFLQKRKSMTKEQVDAGSFAVFSAIKAHPSLQKAKSVFCYLSYGNEVDTHSIIAWLWQQGKEVYVPKTYGGGIMQAVRITQETPLVADKKGILQPMTDGPAAEAVDVALVPGVAFDAFGGRLGYGGGYYDRWLDAHPALRIGLAFEDQMAEKLPAEPHDLPMEEVVTPLGRKVCRAE
ncbi:MAG: 5-formyltetrahydrofolate cyclo-ligase [Christensenellaceae bacterium]|nr:5-formyltetrahydrofolate cyclo-ligase [Christensenellaceae bacterium]